MSPSRRCRKASRRLWLAALVSHFFLLPSVHEARPLCHDLADDRLTTAPLIAAPPSVLLLLMLPLAAASLAAATTTASCSSDQIGISTDLWCSLHYPY